MFSLWPFCWYVKENGQGLQNRAERKPEACWSLSENTEEVLGHADEVRRRDGLGV